MEWDSINSFFGEIDNYSGSYIVLRNYEELTDEKIDLQHADIDILCDKSSKLSDYLKLVSWSGLNDPIHKKARINNVDIKIDLREIGDGYYDEKWEKSLLKNRIKYKNAIYTVNDEDYFYSLIYHALVHKKSLKDDYKARIYKMAEQLKIDVEGKTLRAILIEYMKEKKYYFVIPSDNGVIFNVNNVDRKLLKYDIGRIVERALYLCKKGISKVGRSISWEN